MYTPQPFELDVSGSQAAIAECGLAHLVTAGAHGIVATPLPLFLVPTEGTLGTLYGHLARANLHWRQVTSLPSLAIFTGPEAYITPSWYAVKAESGKVVPTWNYAAVHAYGQVEFFDDAERLLDVVTRLTDLHEGARPQPWSVSDAPADFIAGQLRGIVGLRMPIDRLEGKLKMSQNRTEADRAGVVQGLSESGRQSDLAVAEHVPVAKR